MSSQLHNEEVNIVLRGQFNPALFHPAWFAASELIRRQEADAAKIVMIHPGVAVFTVEWLQLNVTQDRFQVTTAQAAYFETLRDLVVGTLALCTPPLRALGFNYMCNYRIDSMEICHTIGDRLAPKEHWKSLLDEPGLSALTMQGKRRDDRAGYVQVQVQPSTLVKPGIYVTVNDHYQLVAGEEPLRNVTEPEVILKGEWTSFINRANGISKSLVALGDLQ
jgi:hypothetical protein